MPKKLSQILISKSISQLIEEFKFVDAYSKRIDESYSKLFYEQNNFIRSFFLTGDISVEDRDIMWAKVDEKESKFDFHLSFLSRSKFIINKMIDSLRSDSTIDFSLIDPDYSEDLKKLDEFKLNVEDFVIDELRGFMCQTSPKEMFLQGISSRKKKRAIEKTGIA